MYLFATRKVFREEVGGIDFASDFLDRDCASPDLLLEPKRVGLQVSNLSQSGSGRDPERRAGVRPGTDGQCHFQVGHQRLMAQSSSRSLDKTIVLSFARRKGTESCVELQVLMQCWPIIIHPPLVERLVRGQPDQSVSL